MAFTHPGDPSSPNVRDVFSTDPEH